MRARVLSVTERHERSREVFTRITFDIPGRAHPVCELVDTHGRLWELTPPNVAADSEKEIALLRDALREIVSGMRERRVCEGRHGIT